MQARMPESYGASVFLHHRPTGRVLLQHRTNDAPAYPGYWGMFGGGGEAQDDGDHPFEQTEGQGRGWFTPEEALRTLTLTENARRDLTLLSEHLSQRDPLLYPSPL